MKKLVMLVAIVLALTLSLVGCTTITPPQSVPETPPAPTPVPPLTPVPTPSPTPEPLPIPESEPEPEPQPSKVPLSYEVVKAYVKEVEGIEEQIIQIGEEETKKVVVIYLTVACVEVKNTDTAPGTFVVYFFVEKPTFGEMSLKVSLDLESNEVKTAQCPADELGAWSYKIIPSTKTVIE